MDVLLEEMMDKGIVEWNTGQMGSGLYLCKFNYKDFIKSWKTILFKNIHSSLL